MTLQPPTPAKRDFGWWARAVFFVVLPGFGVGGAMGLPALMSAVGVASIKPSLLQRAVSERPLWLLLLLAFAVWATISSTWSAFPNHSQALRLWLTLAPGLLFASAAMSDSPSRRLTLAGGQAAFIVLAVLLAIEAFCGMPFNRAASPPDAPLGDISHDPSRGIALLVVMGWGAAGAFLSQKRPWIAALLLIGTAVLSPQFDQQSTLLAFIVGLCGFALALAAPRLSLMALTGGLATWMLAAPWVTPFIVSNQRIVDMMPPSWAARAGIWDYTAAHIAERPWLGWGMDGARALHDQIVVRDMHIRGIPVHPHSASMQVWFETGAVGAALAALAILCGGWALSRALANNRAAAAAACGSIGSIGIVANLSYNIWAEWWIATMLLAAAMIGAIRAAKA